MKDQEMKTLESGTSEQTGRYRSKATAKDAAAIADVTDALSYAFHWLRREGYIPDTTPKTKPDQPELGALWRENSLENSIPMSPPKQETNSMFPMYDPFGQIARRPIETGIGWTPAIKRLNEENKKLADKIVELHKELEAERAKSRPTDQQSAVGDIVQHHKGGLFVIIGFEHGLVRYKPLTGDDVYTQDAARFFEELRTPRFTKLTTNEEIAEALSK